jgi:hypothetical protein
MAIPPRIGWSIPTPQHWELFFQQQTTAIDAPLVEMEAKGELVPMAQLVVQVFQGMRIQGARVDVSVVILKVKNLEDRKSQVNH